MPALPPLGSGLFEAATIEASINYIHCESANGCTGESEGIKNCASQKTKRFGRHVTIDAAALAVQGFTASSSTPGVTLDNTLVRSDIGHREIEAGGRLN